MILIIMATEAIRSLSKKEEEMIMKKVFGLAAILLALAACNKIDPVAQSTDQAETQQGIPFKATITQTSSKALADAGTTLTATWAVNEKIALVYEISYGGGSPTKYLVAANVDSVEGGTAIISATLSGVPDDNTPVTLIYPASAVDETTKELKTKLLVAQNGLLTGENSISEKYDVRTGSGNLAIAGVSATLKNSVSLSNEFAIYKFTLNAPASAFRVTVDAVDYVATPVSETDVIYMALPPFSGKAVSFKATESGVDYYFSAPSVSLAAGTYYRSDLSAKLKTNPGRLNGAFSVASGKQVYFSQGNLQWFNGGNTHKTNSDTSPTTTPIDAHNYNGGTFIFADHQWDICGGENEPTARKWGSIGDNIARFTSDKRIDLFMYASSGKYLGRGDYHYKPFAVCNNDYWGGEGGYAFGPLTADMAGTDSDWGVFNAILNGSDETGQWRTLTQPEWYYLINTRDNATNLRGAATVNGIRGIVILPDGWTGSFTPITDKVYKGGDDSMVLFNWTDNVYDVAAWTAMEATGAVFLPAAGTLDPGNCTIGFHNVDDTHAGASYWTSSYDDSKAAEEQRAYAYAFDLGTGGNQYGWGNWRFDHSSRPFGRAVRLVQDVPAP